MKVLFRNVLWLSWTLLSLAIPNSAVAVYAFTPIDYPGATYTDLWGINNNGQIAGHAILANGLSIDFVYTGGAFTILPPLPAGLEGGGVGINDAGTIVGEASTPDQSSWYGLILSGGPYSLFRAPGWASSRGRAISNANLVTGMAFNDIFAALFSPGASEGFIYNRTTGVFTLFTPSPTAINVFVQGINIAGQAVGSFRASGTGGITGFLREPNGIISTFRINNASTAPRAINDNGLIAGWTQRDSGLAAFVGTSSGFELLSVPGSTQTVGEGLNNAGQVSGSFLDGSGITHGFIATPVVVPIGTSANGAYIFSVDVVPNVPIFIDPNVAIGYEYRVGDGDPLIATVRLPIGIGDNQYTLILDGHAFKLSGGELFDFRQLSFTTNGASHFRVANIDVSASLDPTNSLAFPTELTFVEVGHFTGTMTPLCQGHPLPLQAAGTSANTLAWCR